MLGEIPLLGRLFRSDNITAAKTEIVLLITPHIVRAIERPEARNLEFLSGTEASVGAGGGAPAPVLPAQPAQPVLRVPPAVQGGPGAPATQGGPGGLPR